MARPCCDPCCHTPLTVYLRISGGCACVDGVCITLVHTSLGPPLDGCDNWTGIGTANCFAKPITAQLSCCPQGCMGSEWQWNAPGKLNLYGGTLGDDWTCSPFFQHWTGMHWDGDVTCVGVTFDVIISEVSC